MDFISILSIFVMACFVGFGLMRASMPLGTKALPRGSKAALLAIGAHLLPAQANAEIRGQMQLSWAVVPDRSSESKPRLVKDGELVLKNRLVPTVMAELRQALTLEPAGSLSVAYGAQLYALETTAGGKLFCAFETLIRGKDGSLTTNLKDMTVCLLDSQGDGRFDARFATAIGPGLPQIQGVLPKEKNLVAVDLPYEIVPADQFKGNLWVGLRYEEYFNIYGNRMLMVAYGGRGKDQTLTDFSKFKAKGPFPLTAGALGARLTVLEAPAGGCLIRVDRPISIPVFGVVTTTTVRFY